MSLLSTPTYKSETTYDSSFVATQIRQYERESYDAINKVFDRSQMIDQLIYSQFFFGHGSRTTVNAIECGATQIRKSITSSMESAVVGFDSEDNFTFSDVSSTKNLITKRTKTKAFVLAMFIFLLVLASCITPLIIFLPRSEIVCDTEQCYRESAKKMEKMNQQADPCTDSYVSFCGNFEKDSKIPDDKTEITSFSAAKSEMLDGLKLVLSSDIEDSDIEPFWKAKKLFAACNDVDRLEMTGKQDVLHLLRYNPVIGIEKWSEYIPKWKWQSFDEQSYHYGMSGPYYVSFELVPGSKYFKKSIIKMGPPNTLIDREVLLNDAKGPLVQSYYDYQVDISELLGANYTIAKVLMKAVLNFEIKLAEISTEPDNTPSGNRNNTLQTIDQLNKNYPYNDWLQYFQNLLPDENLNLNSSVQVETPSYFEKLGGLLSKTERITYISYGFWRITADAIDFLPSSVRGRHQEYLRQTTGITVSEPRWVKCVETTVKYFPDAVSALYAKQHSMDDGKLDKIREHISEIAGNLKLAVKGMVDQVDWMDEATKTASLMKIDNMTVQVGFPENITEDQEITRQYKSKRPVEIKEDNFYETTRILNIAYGTHSKLGKTGKSQQDLSSKFLPSFKAEYSPSDNTITVPIVLLNHFFHENTTSYNNYGQIGLVIARNMIRAVMDPSEWTNETAVMFAKKAECVVELYGNFTDDHATNFTEVAKRTLVENVIDNGGMKAAYKAYTEWSNHTVSVHPGVKFTSKQMFWVSAAQMWCSAQREQAMKEILGKGSQPPDRYRILGSLMSSDKFADDFKCQTGSPMNPVDRCAVW